VHVRLTVTVQAHRTAQCNLTELQDWDIRDFGFGYGYGYDVFDFTLWP